MKLFWAIAVGAAAGGLSRFYLTVAVEHRFGAAFPWGTLLINVTGSLLLGFFIRYAIATPSMSLELRLMLTTGFCGGYTTFSSYSYETALLLESGAYGRGRDLLARKRGARAVATFCGFMLARGVIGSRVSG